MRRPVLRVSLDEDPSMVADAPGRGEGRGRQAIGHPIGIWAVDGDLGWVVCQLIVAAAVGIAASLLASCPTSAYAERKPPGHKHGRDNNQYDRRPSGAVGPIETPACSEDVDQRSA